MMGKRNEYIDYLLELMSPLGQVSARAMFGGFGVYADGVFFAIVVDDVLYLKTDEENRPHFESIGLEPFTYEAKGTRMSMSYHRCPEEALESAPLMAEWARGAIAAALRAKAGRTRSERPRASTGTRVKPKRLKQSRSS